MNDVREKTIGRLRERSAELRREWQRDLPFPYVVIDDFLPDDVARGILAAYPDADSPKWERKTYTHQRDKLVMTADFPQPIDDLFGLLNDEAFRAVISEITGIPKLIDDPELAGGGLHQLAAAVFSTSTSTSTFIRRRSCTGA